MNKVSLLLVIFLAGCSVKSINNIKTANQITPANIGSETGSAMDVQPEPEQIKLIEKETYQTTSTGTLLAFSFS